MSSEIIVLKLTGKVFDETELLVEYVELFRELVNKYKLVIVSGGGSIAREYIRKAGALGVRNNYWLDRIGIEASRLNSYLLISALQPHAYPEPVKTLEDVVKHTSRYDVVVLGGLIPGQSTAAVAVEVSEALGIDRLIDVGAVDHVYNKDPRIHRDAKRYVEINASELIKILEQKILPGEYALIDEKALELAVRSGIEIWLTYYKRPGDLVRVLRGENTGTVIHPR